MRGMSWSQLVQEEARQEHMLGHLWDTYRREWSSPRMRGWNRTTLKSAIAKLRRLRERIRIHA